MTTIKSTLRGSRAQLVINESDPADNLAVGETSLMVITGTGAGNLVHVPTADLAAALGLVTREDAADMERTTEGLRAETIRLRNGLSEAKVAKGAWKAKWEIEHERAEMLDGTARALRAELDEAEATIARVRELAERWRTPELLAALDPKPAFVLPTEAGARFTAKRVGNLAHTSEFVTISDGDGAAFYYIPDSLDGYGTEHHIWPGDRVMREWTGHRLIGARVVSRADSLAGLTEAIDKVIDRWGDTLPTADSVPVHAQIAEAALAWLEGHGWAEVITGSHPIRTYYSSYTPDGKLWCQTRDPEEVRRMSEGKDCTFERYDVYERGVTSAWAPVEAGEDADA